LYESTLDFRDVVFKRVCALLVLGAFFVAASITPVHAAAGATAPRVVTLASAGRTITMHPGSLALLRLNHERWRWSTPSARGVGLKIEAIDYERDPGFDEWKITTRAPGRARVTVTGTPCNRCSISKRIFRVTIVVSRN